MGDMANTKTSHFYFHKHFLVPILNWINLEVPGQF